MLCPYIAARRWKHCCTRLQQFISIIIKTNLLGVRVSYTLSLICNGLTYSTWWLSCFSQQNWRIMMSKSTSLKSKYVSLTTEFLCSCVWWPASSTCEGVILSSPVICLLLFLLRIHLLSHIKRVKSLFREECVQRYKEILASTRTWSRFWTHILFQVQTLCLCRLCSKTLFAVR